MLAFKRNLMSKSPRKPTGAIGPTCFSADGAEFLQVEFPRTKEGIEELIVKSFVRSSNTLPMTISGYIQNSQNDFDFTVKTAGEKNFLS
jgi:hypothetical protein